ncbi:MAG: protein kinase domain-containing protein, partial [Candidatus Sericytochromatia bacterium]
MTTQQIASRYNVIKKLGEGGMGLVQLVEDTTTGEKVALKVLSAAIGATEETILQFKQEFRVMSTLKHPNCCAVYDFGQLPDGAPYLTMEVVPGHGLDEIVPLAPDQFKSVFSQLLLALGYVHNMGYVHCDIKSENARVRPDGAAKLMDFGLMERAGRSGGAIKGTLGYMAPEMAKGGRLDQRADLYSVGCLGYEMLTGQLPFPTENPVEIIKHHINDMPVPPSKIKEGIDPEIERILMKLMAKEPLARYQSAFDVLEEMGVEVPEGMGGSLLSAPFVGREAEMERLNAQLAAIAAGKAGQATLITGPAGAGKTRLTDEFRFAVQLENLPFVVGPSFESGTSPYGPFVEILKGLLPAFKEHVPDELAKHGPVLVKLMPELGFEPAPDLDPPSKEKMRLQVTITEVIASLCKKRGICMIFEDWQWADALSIETLTYLLRNTKDAPLLTIMTHRDAPEGEPAWLPMANQLALPGLTEDEIKAMVASMLGTEEIGPAFLGKIVEFAEGNPFFVEGLLDHLVRNKTLVKAKGKWNSDIELTPDQMPANLQGLLLEKLEALPEEAMQIARIGAVIGREFGLDLLMRVTGMSDNQLFDALDQLAQHGVFAKTDSGAFRFEQGKLQEVLYQNIEDELKTSLH